MSLTRNMSDCRSVNRFLVNVRVLFCQTVDYAFGKREFLSQIICETERSFTEDVAFYYVTSCDLRV